VVPDNVLFEGGAGEKVRRNLLQKCRVHIFHQRIAEVSQDGSLRRSGTMLYVSLAATG
jgi:hypothetical protein